MHVALDINVCPSFHIYHIGTSVRTRCARIATTPKKEGRGTPAGDWHTWSNACKDVAAVAFVGTYRQPKRHVSLECYDASPHLLIFFGWAGNQKKIEPHRCV